MPNWKKGVQGPQRRYVRRTTKKTVKKLAKRVKALENNAEYKVAYYSASQIMDSTATVNHEMGPRALQGTEGEGDVGAEDNIRIGNSINLRYLVIEGIVELPKTAGVIAATTPCVQCRVLIADNIDGNTGLAITDLLQDSTTVPRTLVSPWKNSVAGGKKYKMYKDMKFSLTQPKPSYRFKFKLPIKKEGRVLNYDENASAHPSNFNLSLVSYADTAPLAALRPTISYTVKTRFTDS